MLAQSWRDFMLTSHVKDCLNIRDTLELMLAKPTT
jgi:hypothetical protein